MKPMNSAPTDGSDAQRVCDLTAALQEIVRLRLATNEGTCRVRFDRAWQVAENVLKKQSS